MSTAELAFTVGTWVVLTAVGYVVVGDDALRSWASSRGGRTATWVLGLLAGLSLSAGAGAFSVSPPAGVYVFAAVGVLAFSAAVVAAAGAADVALAAVAADPSFGRRVRAFWYASATRFRATRYALALSFVGFAVAAVAGGVAVDPAVSAVGALAVGGVLACATGFAAVGAFVPGGRNETVAEDVERAG
jgi:hypothetical protein